MMYGPIVIGGPCELCGSFHAGQTCEQYQESTRRAIKRLLRGIDIHSGQKIPNCWAGVPTLGKSDAPR
jgi:hypothetical protein